MAIWISAKSPEHAATLFEFSIAIRARLDKRLLLDVTRITYEPAGIGFAPRRSMAVLEFTDANGGQWLVWATIPSPGSVLGPLGSGWLTFDGPSARRRLSPIPDGWEVASQRQLEQLFHRAVTIRRTPAGGTEAQDKL